MPSIIDFHRTDCASSALWHAQDEDEARVDNVRTSNPLDTPNADDDDGEGEGEGEVSAALAT